MSDPNNITFFMLAYNQQKATDFCIQFEIIIHIIKSCYSKIILAYYWIYVISII